MRQLVNGFLALSYLAAVGCTSVPVVYKPEVETVKDIAFVQLYADPVLRNDSGEESSTSQVSSWANTLRLSGENGSKKDVVKALDFGGTRLVEYAYTATSKQLSGIKGWNFVKPEEYAQNPKMLDFVKDSEERFKKQLGVMAKISDPQAVRYPGLAGPLYFKTVDDETKAVKKLAADLGHSSIAKMGLDFTYSASTAIGGTGTARLIVTNWLELVNKDGKKAVRVSIKMPSDDTVPMVAGNIAFSEKTEAILKATIDKSLAKMKEKIVAEL